MDSLNFVHLQVSKKVNVPFMRIIHFTIFRRIIEDWKKYLICSLSVGRVNCPCPEQGRNPNSRLSSAIFARILPTEPENHDQTIHTVPVNGLIVILRFYG